MKNEKHYVDFNIIPDGFRVVIIGSGAPGINLERGNPATLVQFKHKYFLVDCGSNSVYTLFRLGLHVGKISNLLITHQHLDHNADYFNFLITGWASPHGRRSLTVIGPETQKQYDMTRELYDADIYGRAEIAGFGYDGIRDHVQIIDIDEDLRTIELDGVRITAMKVPHGNMLSYAYRFDAEGESVAISGDLIYSKKLLEFFKGSDILVMDANQLSDLGGVSPEVRQTRMKFTSEYHISEEEIGEVAKCCQIKKLVLTHINGELYNFESIVDNYRKIAFEGEIIEAYDGLDVLP